MTQYHSGAHWAFKELSAGVIWILSLFVCLQDGKVLFPAPQPQNVPVAAPPKQKSVQELQKEKAAAVSPFRATLTTAGVYTGGKSHSMPSSSHRIPPAPSGLIWKQLPVRVFFLRGKGHCIGGLWHWTMLIRLSCTFKMAPLLLPLRLIRFLLSSFYPL